ncbi:stalk domain-containing protein [Paenibacillus sp. MBLB4367]|uniref:stalk domain-containing protein n=1 Tax=Paenibacillus sp. MBLB4367 TaxID=3384767 RepID=UPI0039080C42
MQKRSWWIASAAAVLAYTAVAASESSLSAAAETVKAVLFPHTITINGQSAPLREGLEILNYEGATYVPLRYLAEQMGGRVRYDGANKTISIDTSVQESAKAALSSVKREDSFALSLHSEKAEYREGEPLRIWGSLRNAGDSDVTIGHGLPVLYFSIMDGKGRIMGGLQMQPLIKDTMKPGNEFAGTLPFDVVQSAPSYNEDWTEELPEEMKEATWLLPAGHYTVKLSSDFSVYGETGEKTGEKKLRTAIQIDVTK